MINRHLTKANGDWREKIIELETLLAQIRPQLIEAEAGLADRLTVISAFEFKLRARIEPLTRRLEKLHAEIQEHRRQLRQLQEDYAFANDMHAEWEGRQEWQFDPQKTAASGEYRYRETPLETPPIKLNEDDTSALKQLYRQLARRFHPDLALDDVDRAYRTRIMKAINVAYSAGDLAQLKKLAQEPNSADRIEYAHTKRQLVQALYVELTRCRRRLAEINEEMSRLECHKSARLLNRTERAAAEGRDLLAKISHELQDEIAHKLMIRDVLKQQVEQFGQEEPDFGGDALADAVMDIAFEDVFAVAETAVPENWRQPIWDDDILDDPN